MKKKFLFFVALLSSTISLFSFDKKAKITLGVTPLSKTADEDLDFGSAYLLSDFALSNNYITVGGKIYHRLSKYDDSKDVNKDKTLSQKIDIKRAYLRFRPFGNEIFETSIGKLYSYYLTGNFFSLSENYTGQSRWGKTGVGAKWENYGFTVGVALPITESYVEFANSFGINAALVYDFSNLNKNVPLKVSGTFFYSYEHSESQDKKTSEIISTKENDFRGSFSINYAPKISGFFSGINSTFTFSYNSEPYVASRVFKNVANYNAENLDECWFFSLNHKNNFGKVQFVLEGEVGHSLIENMIPLYVGTQVFIPIVEQFSLKPRFFYYAALNSENAGESRQTFEFYPRIVLPFGSKNQWNINVGADFLYKQTAKDDWSFEWNLPLYVEYKIGDK